MSPQLKKKVQEYRVTGCNLFSFSEKIMVALCCEDLYPMLMPEKYKSEPMAAYFQELDGDQRQLVMAHHQGY